MVQFDGEVNLDVGQLAVAMAKEVGDKVGAVAKGLGKRWSTFVRRRSSKDNLSVVDASAERQSAATETSVEVTHAEIVGKMGLINVGKMTNRKQDACVITIYEKDAEKNIVFRLPQPAKFIDTLRMRLKLAKEANMEGASF